MRERDFTTNFHSILPQNLVFFQYGENVFFLGDFEHCEAFDMCCLGREGEGSSRWEA